MHPLTNSAISSDIPFHQYWSFKRVVSFLAPEWLIQWASARMNGTNNNGTIITDKPDFNFLFKIPLSINKVLESPEPFFCTNSWLFFGFRIFLLVFVKRLSQNSFKPAKGVHCSIYFLIKILPLRIVRHLLIDRGGACDQYCMSWSPELKISLFPELPTSLLQKV